MIDIKKLKKGDRLQFSKDTWAIVTNYESDISHLKGEVEEINFLDSIWVKLDKPNKDFKDYNNSVQFALVDGSGGSDKSYLEKADLLFNYEVVQSYIQTDYFAIFEARNVPEAIDGAMKEWDIRNTSQEETETKATIFKPFVDKKGNPIE